MDPNLFVPTGTSEFERVVGTNQLTYSIFLCVDQNTTTTTQPSAGLLCHGLSEPAGGKEVLAERVLKWSKCSLCRWNPPLAGSLSLWHALFIWTTFGVSTFLTCAGDHRCRQPEVPFLLQLGEAVAPTLWLRPGLYDLCLDSPMMGYCNALMWRRLSFEDFGIFLWL